MAVDIRALISKKTNEREKKLPLKDINRSLFTSMLAVSVYGKGARDEEILSIIIGDVSERDRMMKTIRTEYDELVRTRAGEIKRNRKGETYLDGFMVLVPRHSK